MAGFGTHISVSTILGVGYGWWGSEWLHLPTASCVVAGGLTSIGGMMPDLDSDSGIPARETIGFAAAVLPMLVMNRMAMSGMNLEHMVAAGVPMYLVLRFGLGEILRRFTVHRGMFHSIPAILIAGMLVFLVCEPGAEASRSFKAAGAMLGYGSHLVLDEIWSVSFAAGVPRLKKSFGTALKLVGNDFGPTAATYGILLMLGLTVLKDVTTPHQQIKTNYIVSPSIGRPDEAPVQRLRRPGRTAERPLAPGQGGWNPDDLQPILR
jgi:membrane-bound metal-dependent hydrolase YbcI (DUF457 family)